MIESLEARRLLAASVANPVVLQSDGTLILTGTAGEDYMTINVVAISQKLVVNSQQHLVVNGTPSYRAEFHENFDVSQVSRIEVHAGAGRDVVHLLADIPSEIWGDDDNDALFAWDISGSTGHVVHGGDGRDNISTGDGNDTIFGDASPDEIFAHGGNDLISGGGGGDALHGYAGRDRIYGGAGDDLVYGEDQADRLNGQAGNDTIVGGGGNDTLTGGTGQDILRGDRGDDFFNTNDDADPDTLIGGSGNDTGSVDTLLDSANDVA